MRNLEVKKISETVDGYINNLTGLRKERAQRVYKIIKGNFPEVVESLRYRIPTFDYQGNWVALANQKNHLSVYFCSEELIRNIKKKYPRLSHGKSCINIKDKNLLPIKELVVSIKKALNMKKEADSSSAGVNITPLLKWDVPFLLNLWQNRQVMKYADEFPLLRGWSRINDSETAWRRYQEKRRELGKKYTQFIIRLPDGTKIGESFFAPLREGRKMGEWLVPTDKVTLLGDIKLLPDYWGKGFGTEAMLEVIRYAFKKAGCGIFVVTPHEKNMAAKRLYEKVGFKYIIEKSQWVSHGFMTLDRNHYLGSGLRI